MKIDLTKSHYIATKPPLAVESVGSSSSPDAEEAAQAAFYLGEIALLCNQEPAPGTPAFAELQRVVGLYLGADGFDAKVTDPTISAIIKNLMSILAPDGTINSITPTGIVSFLVQWDNVPSDPHQALPYQLFNWFAPDSGGAGGYTFDSSTSSDTIFAFTMFISSMGMTMNTGLDLTAKINAFFGMGQGGGPDCEEWAYNFLCGYTYTKGIPADVIASILPKDSQKAMPNYDQFVSDFTANYSTWASSLPSWETPQEALDGIQTYYLYYLENPGQ